MSGALIDFPRAAETDHTQTIRIQRNTYANALRSVRRTRDIWRKRAHRSDFTSPHHNDRADAAQAVAYFLRFHVRMTVGKR